MWVGPESITSNTAKVRARVWREEDFPCPDFETGWQTLRSNQGLLF